MQRSITLWEKNELGVTWCCTVQLLDVEIDCRRELRATAQTHSVGGATAPKPTTIGMGADSIASAEARIHSMVGQGYRTREEARAGEDVDWHTLAADCEPVETQKYKEERKAWAQHQKDREQALERAEAETKEAERLRHLNAADSLARTSDVFQMALKQDAVHTRQPQTITIRRNFCSPRAARDVESRHL